MKTIKLKTIRNIARYDTVEEAIGSVKKSLFYHQIASISEVVNGCQLISARYCSDQVWLSLSNKMQLHIWQDGNVALCNASLARQEGVRPDNQLVVEDESTISVDFYDKRGRLFNNQILKRSRVILPFIGESINNLYESDGLIGIHFKGRVDYPVFSPMWNMDVDEPFLYWYVDRD